MQMEHRDGKSFTRREFLRTVGAGLAAAAVPGVFPAGAEGAGDPANRPYFLAVQTHGHDYFLEGAENACRAMKEKGGFNAMLFAATYVSESKWVNHQPGNEYDVESGAYFFPDLKLYQASGVTPIKAPAKGMENYDALREASAAARKVGIGLYAWLSDYDRPGLAAQYPELQVCGPDGKPAGTDWFCLNNPRAQQFVLAFYEDIARNHDVDGFFVDRIRTPEAVGYCFCSYCKQKMREAGGDPEHVAQVMAQAFAKKDDRRYAALFITGLSIEPVFYFPELPEIVLWHNVKAQAVADHVRRVKELVKGINPKLGVGLDLWSPLSAIGVGQDFRALSHHCDWIKPMLYHHSTARGVRHSVQGMVQSSGGKISPQEAFDRVRGIFLARGIEIGPTWDEFNQRGMPPAWVTLETRYCEELVEGRCLIYPGIQGWDPATPEQIEGMLQAALDPAGAGAQGITTYCWSNLTWEKIEVYRKVFATLPIT